MWIAPIRLRQALSCDARARHGTIRLPGGATRAKLHAMRGCVMVQVSDWRRGFAKPAPQPLLKRRLGAVALEIRDQRCQHAHDFFERSIRRQDGRQLLDLARQTIQDSARVGRLIDHLDQRFHHDFAQIQVVQKHQERNSRCSTGLANYCFGVLGA